MDLLNNFVYTTRREVTKTKVSRSHSGVLNVKSVQGYTKTTTVSPWSQPLVDHISFNSTPSSSFTKGSSFPSVIPWPFHIGKIRGWSWGKFLLYFYNTHIHNVCVCVCMCVVWTSYIVTEDLDIVDLSSYPKSGNFVSEPKIGSEQGLISPWRTEIRSKGGWG